MVCNKGCEKEDERLCAFVRANLGEDSAAAASNLGR